MRSWHDKERAMLAPKPAPPDPIREAAALAFSVGCTALDIEYEDSRPPVVGAVSRRPEERRMRIRVEARTPNLSHCELHVIGPRTEEGIARAIESIATLLTRGFQ